MNCMYHWQWQGLVLAAVNLISGRMDWFLWHPPGSRGHHWHRGIYAAGIKPLRFIGYTLGSLVAILSIVGVIGLSSAGAIVGGKIAMPTLEPTATLTGTPAPPTATPTATPIPPTPTIHTNGSDSYLYAPTHGNQHHNTKTNPILR